MKYSNTILFNSLYLQFRMLHQLIIQPHFEWVSANKRYAFLLSLLVFNSGSAVQNCSFILI